MSDNILLRKGVDYSLYSSFVDSLGRFIILKVRMPDRPYVLVNVYAPNKLKDKEIPKFFDDLLATINGC